MKKSILLFQDQKEVFDSLSDEQAGKMIKAIFQYQENGEMILDDPLLKIIMIPIRQAIDRSSEKYDSTCKRNAENIAKRWNKENTKNTSGINGKVSNTKNTNSDSDSDSDTEDSKESISKEKISKKEISVKYTPDFLEWWTLYDKVDAGGKKQCFEKWQKLPTHERQKIIEHTAHYVKVQSEKQYRKNPITYLNQKPYEDFLIGAGATSPTQDNSIEALRQRKIAEHESYKQLWGRIPSVQ